MFHTLAQHQRTVSRMRQQQQSQLTTSTTPHRQKTHASHYARASNSTKTAADARAEMSTAPSMGKRHVPALPVWFAPFFLRVAWTLAAKASGQAQQ